jgi:hypothetical protein
MFRQESVDMEQAEIAEKADAARRLHEGKDGEHARTDPGAPRRRWFRFLRRR